ncbi:MAG: MATE family efflux transporter [Spirochaetes bacterium]|nr:MATE family efflux transporter [Spirochaetota bacterium]
MGYKKARLTKGPVGKTLVILTIPMIGGILGMVGFNLIDTFFVGQIGKNELAAMSFTFPVVLFIGSISMGIGIGLSSVVSRAIGEANYEKVKRLTTDGLILALLVATITMIIGLFTITPLFRFLGAGEELMPFIKTYMTIWYIGVPFVVLPMVGNNAIRATGDTLMPSIIMFVAVTVNLVLDPLLIFGYGFFPKLGLAGAAIATVIARAITFLVSFWILYFRDKMITFILHGFRNVIISWKQILYVGLPAVATNLITPISIGVITRLLATYGKEAVAGFGVASRIERFTFPVVMALACVLGPFVGQNYGAKKYKRVIKGVQYSTIFALIWGLVVFFIFLVSAKPVASLFNNDEIIVKTIAMYLTIVSLSFGAHGVLLLVNSSLNAFNQPIPSAILSIIKMFFLYIPLAYLGSYLFEIKGIFYAVMIANLISGTIGFFWLKIILLKQGKSIISV